MVYALLSAALGLTLETRATLPAAPSTVHRFISTPPNWPKFVVSSSSVEGCAPGPLTAGATVDEIFGLPPVLPLRVTWTCDQASEEQGTLRVVSPSGLAGVARECVMDFTITDSVGDKAGCDITLIMSYEPVSPIALFALPVLAADNALALKVMLRRALAVEDGEAAATTAAASQLAASKLGTMDPIAGPLVMLGRRLGLLPEKEEDGWQGEPTAWATADSVHASTHSPPLTAAQPQLTRHSAAQRSSRATQPPRSHRSAAAHAPLMRPIRTSRFHRS